MIRKNSQVSAGRIGSIYRRMRGLRRKDVERDRMIEMKWSLNEVLYNSNLKLTQGEDSNHERKEKV
jgi:hypothetical protein